MAKKKSDELDNKIAAAWRVHGDRVQIPMMDIPKIFANARAAVADGFDLDEHLQLVAAHYKERATL